MEPFQVDAWRDSWTAMNSYAWWFLNHSADLPSSVSGGNPFHGVPRLQLFDDTGGYACDLDPITLTVFELFKSDDGEGRTPVVREAVWRRSTDLQRIHSEVERTGETVSFKPTVSMRDAVVPDERLSSLLREASTFRIAVVSFSWDESVTTDVGAQGFEFYSRDQPTAALRLQ